MNLKEEAKIDEDFTQACLGRVKNILADIRNEMTKDESIPSREMVERMTADPCLLKVVQNIAACDVPRFKEAMIPFGFVIHPDKLEFKNETDNRTHVLLAATKHKLEIDRKTASEVTLSIWFALYDLWYDFSEGGDFMNVQQAYNVCKYRVWMVRGLLCFNQSRNSGLDKEPGLAALVELSVRKGYWLEVYEDRLIIEHDIAFALHRVPSNQRFVKSSFVALFDSGQLVHPSNKQEFKPLSNEAIRFLAHLLRTKNIPETCQRLRKDLVDWKTQQLFDLETVKEPTAATIVASLFEDRMFNPPLVSTNPVTLMVTFISDEVIEHLKRSMDSCTDVQLAFELVIDLFLLRNDSKFITSVRSVMDTPDTWPLTLSLPTLVTPVSVGVIRIKSRLDLNRSKQLAASVSTFVSTLNHACWRIPSKHHVYCTSPNKPFDMMDSWSQENQDHVKQWRKIVCDVSRPNLEEARIHVGRELLEATDFRSTSFLFILTWDSMLCRRATMSCAEEMNRFGIEQIDFYHQNWTVDVVGIKLQTPV